MMKAAIIVAAIVATMIVTKTLPFIESTNIPALSSRTLYIVTLVVDMVVVGVGASVVISVVRRFVEANLATVVVFGKLLFALVAVAIVVTMEEVGFVIKEIIFVVWGVVEGIVAVVVNVVAVLGIEVVLLGIKVMVATVATVVEAVVVVGLIVKRVVVVGVVVERVVVVGVVVEAVVGLDVDVIVVGADVVVMAGVFIVVDSVIVVKSKACNITVEVITQFIGFGESKRRTRTTFSYK